MSFILEALKKADAERDRGAVPDLHAQAMLPEAAFEDDTGGRGRPWRWLLAGAGLALLVGIAWQWIGSDTPELVAVPAPPVAASPVGTAPPLPPIAAMPTAPAAQHPGVGAEREGASAKAAIANASPPAKPLAAVETMGTHPEAARGSGQRTTGVEARKAEPKQNSGTGKQDAGTGRTAGAKQAVKPDAAPAPKTAAKATPPPAAAERVPLLSELPDDARRQIPKLAFGGLVHSAQPASRMLIINGDVQREGSTVAPGLTLERINPKSAVFSLRGQRFEVPIDRKSVV